VDAVENGGFVLPANGYPGAGAGFATPSRALEYISENTGVTFGKQIYGRLGTKGDYVVFNQYLDGRPTHVLWARVRADGNSYFYDPQLGSKVDPSKVGAYSAYPIEGP
jgi:hypothetical protein